MCPRCLSRKKIKRISGDDTMIHQFRMYIDKHNIEYVRNNLTGRRNYEEIEKLCGGV